LDWRYVNPQVRERCRAFADEIDAKKRNLPSARYWNRDAHYDGLIGEWLVAQALGLDVNENLLVGGDGKVDFPGIDVKTSRYWREPHLRLNPNELYRDINFVLVAWDEGQSRARIVGWASTERVLALGEIRDYGYGPRHCLLESQLFPGLPLVSA
jgi:hypothetical protein